MSIQFSDIDDAVLLTQEKLIKRKAFVDMQTDLSDHVAVREMWKNRKKVFAGGNDWRIDYQMDHNHSARAVGLYESDGGSIRDTMVKGTISPRHVTADYIYDLREPAFQRGGVAIVDLVKTKYTGMMVSFYEVLEEFLWGKPEDSNDNTTPYGLAYWVTKNDTEGFHGGNPAGFPQGRAGISTDVYPRYANYTGKYDEVSKKDLIRKMRNAARKTKFRSPVSHAVPNLGATGNGIYMNNDTIGLFEEALEAQNMNLGNDVASKDGRTVFKGTPLTYAPYLDEDSTDPVYMLDWKTLAVGVLSGWENNLSAPQKVAGKHNVRQVFLDATLNMICSDPRRQAVFSK